MSKTVKTPTAKCPKGSIKRKSYIKRSGKKVKARCIKATSQTGEKMTSIKKRIRRSIERKQKLSAKKFGIPKCKKGEIVREGYHKKSSIRKSFVKRNGTTVKKSLVKSAWVRPVCIKAKGLSIERGTKGINLIGPMVKGDLKKFGYENVKRMSVKNRHIALKKVLSSLKPLPVSRKIRALATLSKNTDPKLSRVFKADYEWIKKTDEYKNR